MERRCKNTKTPKFICMLLEGQLKAFSDAAWTPLRRSPVIALWLSVETRLNWWNGVRWKPWLTAVLAAVYYPCSFYFSWVIRHQHVRADAVPLKMKLRRWRLQSVAACKVTKNWAPVDFVNVDVIFFILFYFNILSNCQHVSVSLSVGNIVQLTTKESQSPCSLMPFHL